MTAIQKSTAFTGVPILDKNGDLKNTLGEWDKEQLVEYAVSMTQALRNEKETVKSLTTRYTSAQNWALGLALVEEIGKNLASTLNLTEVLTRLLTRTYELLRVEDGSIMLVEEPSGDLVAQIVLGSLSQEPFRVPKGQGIAGEVAYTGVPVIVNDVQSDTRHFKQIDENTGFVTKSLMCVPILTHEKILGVLEIINKKEGEFSHQDQILLSSIANYAGIAIENAHLHQNVVEERNHVLHAQEDVSHKLQRDLHDGPTQLIAALQMSIDFCQKAMQHNKIGIATDELASMMELAKRASHQMRTLLFELRPLILETKGLMAAIEMYLERRQEEEDQSKLHLICKSDQNDGKISRLESEIEAALFAIIQESVNNAAKHAVADNISVILNQQNNQLTVTIADDGAGFDVQQVTQDYEDRGSYGMVNLRERVALAHGNYTINSAPGQGTEIIIHVPLKTALAQ